MQEQTWGFWDSFFLKVIEKTGVTVIHTHHKSDTIHYLSNNIEQYGFNKADFIKDGSPHLDKFLIPFQQNYPVMYAQLYEKAQQTWSPAELKTLKSISMGLRYLTHQKNDFAFLNTVYFDDFDENSASLRSYCFMENINHLLKNDHFWIRIWHTEKPSKVLFYHSNADLILTNDILSKKEWEIMGLIVDNKSDAEIIHDLKISENSLNRYIRIISDKLNVKNRTALAILAKLIQ